MEKIIVQGITEKTNKVELIINHELFVLPFGAVNDLYLYPGKELNKDEYFELRKYKTLDPYLKYLGRIIPRYQYTKVQIKEKLVNKFPEISKEQISSLIKILEKDGHLNDDAYLEEYLIYAKNRFYSWRRIEKELIAKGIYTFEERFPSFDLDYEKEAIEANIEKITRQNNRLDVQQLKKKIYDRLLALGFRQDLIHEAVNKLRLESDTDPFEAALSVALKVKRMALNRRSAEEIKSKIKEKLFKMGYDKRIINLVMEEIENEN